MRPDQSMTAATFSQCYVLQELSSCWDGPQTHNRHGPKNRGGGAVPCLGEAGSLSNTMWPGPRLPPYQVGSSSIQSFGHNTPTSQTPQR